MPLVGLYGGSFNPPHTAHLFVPKTVHEQVGLDEVWMMPTPASPLKDPKDYAPFEDRMEMCRILAEGHEWLKPVDIERHFSSRASADTLDLLSEMYPDTHFVWIIGADNLADFHKWRRWQEIMDHYPLAVLARPGDGEKALQSEAAKYADTKRVDNPKHLVKVDAGWCLLDNTPMNFSSSAVRQALVARSRYVPGLPDKVRAYIEHRGLFGLKRSFSKSVKPLIEKNDVPMEAFKVLVRAAHVMKAAGAVTKDEALDYYKAVGSSQSKKGIFKSLKMYRGRLLIVRYRLIGWRICRIWLCRIFQEAKKIRVQYLHGVRRIIPVRI